MLGTICNNPKTDRQPHLSTSRHRTSRQLIKHTRKALNVLTLLAFLASGNALPLSYAFAQEALLLPPANSRLELSTSFAPPLLRGIKVYPDDPLHLAFILDQGDSSQESKVKAPAPDALKSESTRMLKYFLAALTVPEKDIWVNLSPYEQDRIVPDGFGQTEMGRDLLAQDYVLKQITASVIYPENKVGQAFWDKVYSEAQKRFGTTDMPVDTFNKVWIVPEKAEIYENGGAAFVVESRLKVMLESDYLAESKTSAVNGQQNNHRNLNDTLPRSGAAATDGRTWEGASSDDRPPLTADLSKQILREIVIPTLEKEVNEGQNFATLRQVYHSLILATWYKRKVKDSLLKQAYVAQNKTAGIDIADKDEKDKIWQRYVEAFRQGAYNLIKEEYDPATQSVIPRKYFSGGIVADAETMDHAMRSTSERPSDSVVTDPLVVDTRLAAYDAAMALDIAATPWNIESVRPIVNKLMEGSVTSKRLKYLKLTSDKVTNITDWLLAPELLPDKALLKQLIYNIYFQYKNGGKTTAEGWLSLLAQKWDLNKDVLGRLMTWFIKNNIFMTEITEDTLHDFMKIFVSSYQKLPDLRKSFIYNLPNTIPGDMQLSLASANMNRMQDLSTPDFLANRTVLKAPIAGTPYFIAFQYGLAESTHGLYLVLGKENHSPNPLSGTFFRIGLDSQGDTLRIIMMQGVSNATKEINEDFPNAVGLHPGIALMYVAAELAALGHLRYNQAGLDMEHKEPFARLAGIRPEFIPTMKNGTPSMQLMINYSRFGLRKSTDFFRWQDTMYLTQELVPKRLKQNDARANAIQAMLTAFRNLQPSSKNPTTDEYADKAMIHIPAMMPAEITQFIKASRQPGHEPKRILLLSDDYHGQLRWGDAIISLRQLVASLLKTWPDKLSEIVVVSDMPDVFRGMDRVRVVPTKEAPESSLGRFDLTFAYLNQYDEEPLFPDSFLKQYLNDETPVINYSETIYLCHLLSKTMPFPRALQNQIQGFGIDVANRREYTLHTARNAELKKIFVNFHALTQDKTSRAAKQQWATIINSLLDKGYQVVINQGATSDVLTAAFTQEVLALINKPNNPAALESRAFQSRDQLLDYLDSKIDLVLTIDTGLFWAAKDIIGLPSIVILPPKGNYVTPQDKDGFRAIGYQDFQDNPLKALDAIQDIAISIKEQINGGINLQADRPAFQKQYTAADRWTHETSADMAQSNSHINNVTCAFLGNIPNFYRAAIEIAFEDTPIVINTLRKLLATEAITEDKIEKVVVTKEPFSDAGDNKIVYQVKTSLSDGRNVVFLVKLPNLEEAELTSLWPEWTWRHSINIAEPKNGLFQQEGDVQTISVRNNTRQTTHQVVIYTEELLNGSEDLDRIWASDLVIQERQQIIHAFIDWYVHLWLITDGHLLPVEKMRKNILFESGPQGKLDLTHMKIFDTGFAYQDLPFNQLIDFIRQEFGNDWRALVEQELSGVLRSYDIATEDGFQRTATRFPRLRLNVLDDTGRPTGAVATYKEVHEQGQFHQVLWILPVDTQGGLLLQKRPMGIQDHPGLWDIYGGHIPSGMTATEAATQLIQRETGIMSPVTFVPLNDEQLIKRSVTGENGFRENVFASVLIAQLTPEQLAEIKPTPEVSTYTRTPLSRLRTELQAKPVTANIKYLLSPEGQNILRKVPGATADSAQINGGINLQADKIDLKTQNSGQGATLNFDPALLTRLQQSAGLTPVIVDILPISSLSQFLGPEKP
ncbi:MAG: NUDIX domain-containing protein [Candidatus Omnitrophica bacterium]|nr:NUDIX domain-containing protein [Candidatus Omnitrophota bacterium]